MGLFCASSGGQQGERAAHGAGRGASRLFASKEPFRITSVCDLGPPVCVMWTKETLCSARETDRGTEGQRDGLAPPMAPSMPAPSVSEGDLTTPSLLILPLR